MADELEPEELIINSEEPVVPEPEAPEEPETPAEEVEEPEAPEEEEPEEPKVSRRESLRIQQVLAKVKEAQAPAPRIPQGLDYSSALDADPEVIKQLEADRQAVVKEALAETQAQRRTDKWETLLNFDAPAIEEKYPQLDKNDSEKFHPALANAINTMYLSAVGYDAETKMVTNPGIRYRDYVDSVFELANEIAGEKIEVSTKNIKKQAARTGLRPDGSRGKRLNLNQSPNQMSDEELQAKIAADFQALGLG